MTATLDPPTSSPMKVLVTGGAGYVASVVIDQLVRAGHEIVVVDSLTSGQFSSVPPGLEFHRADVAEIADVLTPSAGFDAVLHFAGLIAAGESVQEPERYWLHNVAASIALLTAIRHAGVPRLVFSSSAAVYGDPMESPITEAAAANPTSPYGWTKLAIDVAMRHASAASGLGAVSLRYFNVAGAARRADGSWLGERHDPETHLIPLALDVALGRRASISLYGDDYDTPDGTCIRDYIHVEDLARAHLLALAHAKSGEHLIFNLGNGNGYSNREVIDTIRTVTGHAIPVVQSPRRPGDPAVLVASATKAAAELGWRPLKPDLRAIIRDAWDFARDRYSSPTLTR